MSELKNENNDPQVRDVKKKVPRKAKPVVDEESYAFSPPNGGWGWFVVLCAFYVNVVVDGIQLTFGIFLKPISEEFNAKYSEVALAGSLMFGIHLLMGPICAGFNNVFGLRPVTITGSLICCFGVGISYFSTSFWFLYCSFGVIGGMGLGLVYMNSLVITSLYFTTLLPIAIAIVVCGSGVGTMVFAALGQFLLTVTTWKNSFLMEAALACSMSLAAIVFKPLKPVRVKIAPAFSKGTSTSHLIESKTEKDVGESSSPKIKSIYIKTEMPQRKSIISATTVQSLVWSIAEKMATKDLLAEKVKRKLKWLKCCKRDRSKSESTDFLVLAEIRSDDKRRKSYVEKSELGAEDGISSLQRSASTVSSHRILYRRIDIEDKISKKVCLSLKKAILSMFDCHLLKSFDFFLFTISGALQVAGLLVIFTYEKERIEYLGFSEEMSIYFVIVLGGANVFWRLFLGSLSLIPKLNYQAVSVSSIVIGGIATMGSCYYSSIYYQFVFCILFGLALAGFAVFRVVLLVDLVGVDSISVATGINLLFMGISSIISPPLFGYLIGSTNDYNLVFGITGALTVTSGLMLINLRKVNLIKNRNSDIYS